MRIGGFGDARAWAQRLSVRSGVGLVWLALLITAACGSSADKASTGGPPAPPSRPSSSSIATPALVGEWQRLQKCSELEQAMTKAGLHRLPRSVRVVAARRSENGRLTDRR